MSWKSPFLGTEQRIGGGTGQRIDGMEKGILGMPARSLARRISLAIFAVCAAAILSRGFASLFGGNAPLTPFTIAIFASAWYGGLAAGLIATLSSIVAVWLFFLKAIFSIVPIPPGFALIGYFAVLGLVISVVTDKLLTGNAALLKAKMVLETTNERLAMAQEAGRVGTWELDPASGSGSGSQEWFRLHGLNGDVGAISLAVWEQAVHPADRGVLRERVAEAPAQGGEFNLEFRVLWPDSTVHWIALHGAVHRHNKKTLLTGTVHDISERKEYENALSNHAAELETLYKTAPVGLGFMDRDLRFVRVNEQLAAIDGVPIADHTGRTLRETLPADLADLLGPLHRQVLESGEAVLQREVSGWSPARPGHKRDWLVSYSPVKKEDGAIIGIQTLVQDITERKRFEEQLSHTAKLEGLGVLAGGVAHDFNNLLTGILGNATLALDHLPSENPARRPLLDVVNASERAAHLTRQLLAYAGKGRFLIEPLNLSNLVREMSHLIRTSIPRTVQVRLKLQEPLPSIEGDAGQLQQVVMNIIINGAEAVPEGETGTVFVTTGVQTVDRAYIATTFFSPGSLSQGDYVFLEVHDTGCGMDQSTMERIFDPFFTTKFTGRGLGLSAVMGIVRSHRGALKVYSTPGQGTTFKILFPMIEQEVAARPPVALGASVFRDATVLVVDDEDVIRRMAQSTLESYGYHVVVADNGEAAVAQFRKLANQIHLLLLDLTMPGMNGEAVLREVKAIRPDVKVILSSGYNEVEIVQRFTGKGLAGFIQKPYTSAALINKIGAALSEVEH